MFVFESKAKGVVRAVIRGLRRKELKPGECLYAQREAGDKLGVGRGVFREAIHMLADRGLVTVEPYVGTRLCDPVLDGGLEVLADLIDAEESEREHWSKAALDLRCELWALAGGLATRRRSIEAVEALISHCEELEDIERMCATTPELELHEKGFRSVILNGARSPGLRLALNSVERTIDRVFADRCTPQPWNKEARRLWMSRLAEAIARRREDQARESLQQWAREDFERRSAATPLPPATVAGLAYKPDPYWLAKLMS